MNLLADGKGFSPEKKKEMSEEKKGTDEWDSTQWYVVKKGDTLSKIAKEFYGDASLYPQIFEANRDILKDPNLIKIGIKFYREMKEHPQLKGVPIIIVTGVSGDIQKFISSRHQVPPPEGFIAKPVEQEEILSLVKRLIGP